MFFETLKTYTFLILPWFLLGIILTFLVEKFLHPKVLKSLTGKFNFAEIILVMILGMLSPLSIMSFLPIARELAEWGVPTAVLFSFFIAERAYDLQSFFIISSLLGIKLAILSTMVIFFSLLMSAYSLQGEKVIFREKGERKKEVFWKRQLKTLLIVVVGIILGALLKTFIPKNYFVQLSGGKLSGIITSLIIGFSLYLGPILGNYPVAKAFSDLGMSSAGVLTYLTVSPIFNFIIILLFSSSVGFKKTFKAVFVYSITSLVLVLLLSSFL
jgi:uncharacterized membrane protein YraQ (UPF0718 family)